MFERFTESARHVVVAANAAARELGHNHIGTEHELLGLLSNAGGLAAEVLNSFGFTADLARKSVIDLVGSAEEPTEGQIPFTPRGKKVLESASRCALEVGHNHVAPEHILLALLDEGAGTHMRILRDVDADRDAIREAIMRKLPGPVRTRPIAISEAARAEATARVDRGKRVNATCPICHEGELRRMDGPPEWYVIPAATRGLPDDGEKRVGHGMPVGISVCSRCEYVALFLPPTVDGSASHHQ
jgi:ATP-dependent Clp protease ATP-binding subunit ClpA